MLLLLLGPGTAIADPQGAMATYQGRTIDLSQSWEGARVCAVDSDNSVTCYASEEEAEAVLGPQPEPGDLTVQTGCRFDTGAWTYLYDFYDFSGRVLQFRDTGITQNLDTYGFANMTASYNNIYNPCQVKVFDGRNGALYLTTFGGGSASSNLGGFTDRIESIYICRYGDIRC